MPRAAIFDVDGTLLDSVDLHALAWREALAEFGHDVGFDRVRSQIGKGGDQLIPVFLSAAQQKAHGRELEEWRGNLFKERYLPLVRPFTAVPDLLRRTREAGLQIAVASSAKKNELKKYLEIADIAHLVDVSVSAEDAAQSKPAPDIFKVALMKLKIAGADAFAIGDTPYDAEAARKAGIPAIGVLSGGFAEISFVMQAVSPFTPGPPRCSLASMRRRSTARTRLPPRRSVRPEIDVQEQVRSAPIDPHGQVFLRFSHRRCFYAR